MLPCYDSIRILVYSQAKCIKTGPGTHTCQCLSGWKEDGDECQAINKCLDPSRGGCHSNATCIYVGPGQVRGVLWFPNPIYLDLQDFWWLIFYPRVTVRAKVVTTAMGGIVNLSISVWSRRVDVISWWGLKKNHHRTAHIFFLYNVDMLNSLIFMGSLRPPASFWTQEDGSVCVRMVMLVMEKSVTEP